MSLNATQFRFTKMTAMLILYADLLGYELTYGDTYSKVEYGSHSYNSFHYKRLAVDFNLFIDGEYQTTTEAHKKLGKFWKLIGGSWGGNFKHKDGNHYSLGEGR